MNAVSIAVLILLTIITTVEVWKLFLTAPKKKLPLWTVIPVSGRVENIEELLRQVKGSVMWDKIPAKRVVILDLNADPATLDICKKFCEDSPLFTICNKDEFVKSIYSTYS
jgi:hypothetical protein